MLAGMRVLVTGATGLVGSAVARELVSAGHDVRVLARPKSDLSNLAGLPVAIARGDVLDGPSVRAAAEGCDGLVHVAGLVGFRPGMRERLLAVNTTGVAVTLEAARQAGVRRAVVTSSIAAGGGTYRPIVQDETAPSNAEAIGIDYFVSKLRGEHAARQVAARGLEVVILRVGYVLGPGDLARSSGATALLFLTGAIPAYVDGGVSFCDVRDVARAHLAALERGGPGELYLVGGHNLRMGEVVSRFAGVAGLPPPRRIPYPVALVGTLAWETWRLLGGEVRCRVSVDLVRASGLFTFVSSAKAERELGYTILPIEESARDTVRWWVQRGKLRTTTPELRALARESGAAIARPAAPALAPQAELAL